MLQRPGVSTGRIAMRFPYFIRKRPRSCTQHPLRLQRDACALHQGLSRPLNPSTIILRMQGWKASGVRWST